MATAKNGSSSKAKRAGAKKQPVNKTGAKVTKTASRTASRSKSR